MNACASAVARRSCSLQSFSFQLDCLAISQSHFLGVLLSFLLSEGAGHSECIMHSSSPMAGVAFFISRISLAFLLWGVRTVVWLSVHHFFKHCTDQVSQQSTTPVFSIQAPLGPLLDAPSSAFSMHRFEISMPCGSYQIAFCIANALSPKCPICC